MAEIDVTKLIDINGLALFRDGCDNRYYSQASAASFQTSVNTALGGKANVNGSSGQLFNASVLNLWRTGNSSRIPDAFIAPKDVSGEPYIAFCNKANEVTLPLNGGTIITTSSLNIERMKDESSGANFVLTPTPSVFSNIVVAGNTMETIRGSVGALIYYIPSGAVVGNGTVDDAQHFGAARGFYMVTRVSNGNVSETVYIGDANPYTIYYRTSNSTFYRYTGTFTELNAPSVPVNLGNDDNWATATAEDIAGLFEQVNTVVDNNDEP